MTELTEHAKSILRAIADGKEFQDNPVCGSMVWLDCKLTRVLFLVGQQDWDMVRIKPETRSINGVEFAAPTSIRCPIVHTFSQKQLAALCEFKWVMQDSRDTAYQAIVDALEGKPK